MGTGNKRCVSCTLIVSIVLSLAYNRYRIKKKERKKERNRERKKVRKIERVLNETSSIVDRKYFFLNIKR